MNGKEVTDGLSDAVLETNQRLVAQSLPGRLDIRARMADVTSAGGKELGLYGPFKEPLDVREDIP